MSRILLAAIITLAAFASGCAGTPIYPPRPPATPGDPVADPTPARVVLHATITDKALHRALEENVPPTGDGTFPMLGSQRKYTWRRGPIALRFQQGRIGLDLHVDAVADLPVGALNIPLDFRILAEPVVSSEYVAKLQSLDVQVQSDDRIVRTADAVADVLKQIKSSVEAQLKDFSFDLYSTVAEAHMRISRPMELPLGGDASGCAVLKVIGIEAAPTVLAGGVEKDLAIIVAPSVTLPCAPGDLSGKLPPLANVAAIPTGPFTVTVPIAARYDELTKAMSLAFTDGKLFFSKDYPQLYLEKPEVYAADEKLVLKVHLAGPVNKYGINTTLDGDIYLSGHPAINDNELTIPDLEPTIETKNFFLALKAATDANGIRDQARQALRLDIGERLKAVRDKLSTDLSFGNGQGCVKAEAHKIEVSGVHVHGNYLRVYVTANASAAMYMPCP